MSRSAWVSECTICTSLDITSKYVYIIILYYFFYYYLHCATLDSLALVIGILCD